MKKRYIYLLYYKYHSGDDRQILDFSAFIGIFSSRRKAASLIKRYQKLAGFRDYPDAFSISRFAIDSLKGDTSRTFKLNYSKVYMLSHSYQDARGMDHDTFISFFSSWQKAYQALVRLKAHPDYSQHPCDFSIDSQQINLCGWVEGFIPYVL